MVVREKVETGPLQDPQRAFSTEVELQASFVTSLSPARLECMIGEAHLQSCRLCTTCRY